MKKLFEVKHAEGMKRYMKGTDTYVPVESIEGTVIESTLVPEQGLILKLDNKSIPFILLNAQFRLDSGENVTLYSTHMDNPARIAVDGLQVHNKDARNDTRVKFQYLSDSERFEFRHY